MAWMKFVYCLVIVSLVFSENVSSQANGNSLENVQFEHGGHTGDVVGDCRCLPKNKCGSSFLRIKNENVCEMSTDLLCCSLIKNQDRFLNSISRHRAPTCGKRNSNGVGFVFGDVPNEAKNGEFPWMVAILKKFTYIDPNDNSPRTANVYQCGGSLIHPKVVLTSAQCAHANETLFIRAGDWDTQADDYLDPHQDRNVTAIEVHEHFHPTTHANDIALLFLDKEVAPAENVGTVCIKKLNFNTLDLSKCIFSGWGKHRANGPWATVLKRLDFSVLSRNQCFATLHRHVAPRRKLPRTLMCGASNTDGNFCQGDEGSPLICPLEDDTYFQVGIATKHFECGGTKLPSLFVNVSLFHSWIHNKMRLRDLVL